MFKNSITIFKVSGIPIRLHISFLLVLPFLAFLIGSDIGTIARAANVTPEQLAINSYLLGLIMAILLFTSVALHELSHSFVARSKGIEIRDITLMLLGGVAQMEEDPEDSRDEAWVAFAGPLFSMLFGLFLFLIIRATGEQLMADLRLIIFYLGVMNIFLAFFNLLPAFPSDGGRILRSLIARKTSYLEATRIATSVGKFFALLFGLFGILSANVFIIFIAFFIYIGASQEYQSNLMKDTMSDIKVKDLMTKDVSTVNKEITVGELLDKMINERHSGYPVVDEAGNLEGCITMSDIKGIPAEQHLEKNLTNIMTTEIIKVHPEDDLFEAFKKLSKADIGRLMVMEGDELVGILTRSDIMKGYRLKMLREQKENV